ncbi:CoA transferase [Nocardioides sp. AE5]|uniref:CaiB/BaiF CoA transferase family protein n=1 Tax=Nocardioides sp. AE5 TaxID=2962573 RepID=UPI0028821B61|nr:CoA transferase [Nocardioides sp. AE5]MDT0202684.1 CoA transferase [Nocardioides sp. AE5]
MSARTDKPASRGAETGIEETVSSAVGAEPLPDDDRRPVPRVGPLAGIRVADFCWMGVGSVATRLLGDFGAEVIKIENRRRIDRPRLLPIYKGEARNYGEELADADPNRGGLHNNYSRNKLGITVDMKTKRGSELVDRLIAASSVVTENFAPGVMERWGLTYERLEELSPGVIYGRMSGFGHSGPHAHFKSYGPIVQAVSGLSFISGLPGREPSGWGLSYMDNQAAYYNSAALLMAILRRNKTGLGAEIDVSAVEVGISMLGPDLLDVSVNKAVTRRADFPYGNRLPGSGAAPHGVYPAAGEDRWVAIAVLGQDDWERFVRVLGEPEWAMAEEFRTQAARQANQDALDVHVSAWTRDKTPHEVMEVLQAAGVAAGAAQNAQDLNEVDPQLAERGTFFEMDHPVIGQARFEGTPIKFSRSVQQNWRSAPLLGEDNDHVYRHILGLSEDEVADLADEGVI